MQGSIRTISIENVAWNLCILFFGALVLTGIFNITALSSLCFYGMYGSLIAASIISILHQRIKRKGPFLLLVLIITISVMNVLIGASTLSFDYYKKLLLYIGTILMMYFAFDFVPNRNTIKLIFRITQAFSFAFIYKAFITPRYYGSTKFLSLGFTNANLAGMWVFLVTALLLWRATNGSKGIAKIVFWAEIVVLTYICYLTGCRSALASTIGLLAVLLMQRVTSEFSSRVASKMDKLVGTLSIAIPLIFPYIYLQLYKQKYSIQLLDIWGKKGFFSGRQSIWSYALECFERHPIIGAYYQISDGTGLAQMHNIFIDVLASYGVIVFIAVIVLMLWLIMKKLKEVKTESDRTLLYAFLFALICGTFEAAFFSGASGIGIWTCLYIFLMNAKSKHDVFVK